MAKVSDSDLAPSRQASGDIAGFIPILCARLAVHSLAISSIDTRIQALCWYCTRYFSSCIPHHISCSWRDEQLVWRDGQLVVTADINTSTTQHALFFTATSHCERRSTWAIFDVCTTSLMERTGRALNSHAGMCTAMPRPAQRAYRARAPFAEPSTLSPPFTPRTNRCEWSVHMRT